MNWNLRRAAACSWSISQQLLSSNCIVLIVRNDGIFRCKDNFLYNLQHSGRALLLSFICVSSSWTFLRCNVNDSRALEPIRRRLRFITNVGCQQFAPSYKFSFFQCPRRHLFPPSKSIYLSFNPSF